MRKKSSRVWITLDLWSVQSHRRKHLAHICRMLRDRLVLLVLLVCLQTVERCFLPYFAH